MRYPKFLEKTNTIGICALSAGMGSKLALLDEAKEVLKKQGYKTKETKSVRVNNVRAASGKKRALELDELVLDDKVDAIFLATGGDYQIETVPYINYEHIANNPKWLMGYSDPTNLLLPVTLKLDIATLYGFNAGSYELASSKHQEDNLNILKGNLVLQKSYKKTQDFIESCKGNKLFNKDVKWVCKQDELNIKGRLIGGCFEVIEKLIGTEYGDVSNFIEKYKDDGIVWFFDVFSDSAYSFYLTLMQMKYAGFFKYCKGVLFGRVAFPNIEDPKFDYIKAADKALGNIPHIMEMDIGHSEPRMTLINGSIVNVKYKNGKGSLKFELKK